MGWFTKNTMDIVTMKNLTRFTAASILESFGDTGTWPGAKYRTDVMNYWLAQNGHKASFLKVSKLALCADAVSRHVQATNRSAANLMVQGDDMERELLAYELSELSGQILMQKGLAQ